MTGDPVLYVHPTPAGGGRDVDLPCGLLAILAGLPARGVFEDELTDAQLRAAAVVLVDVHWYSSLAPAVRLARRARSVHPAVVVAAGGYTASVLARELVAGSEVDAVVRGDAEEALPQLIDAVRAGRPLAGLSNVTTSSAHEPLTSRISPEGFASFTGRDLDWFPSLKALARRYQRNDRPTLVFPWVPVMRGCDVDCDGCCGSPGMQRAICGRAPVRRSPSSVVAELRHWEATSWVRRVYLVGDLDSPGGRDPFAEILASPFGLALYYEFFDPPEPAALETIAGAFAQLSCTFSTVANHGQFHRPADPAALDRALVRGRALGVDVTLLVNPDMEHVSPGYAAEILALHRAHRPHLLDIREWRLDIPLPSDDPAHRARRYDHFLALSARGTVSERLRRRVRYRAFGSARATATIRRATTAHALWCLRRAGQNA